MKRFNDLGITVKHDAFIGDQIKADRILNQEIIIHAFKLEDSKKVANTKYINMQIEFKGEKRMVFLTGVKLLEALKQVPPEEFPVIAILNKVNGMYELTS